MSIVYTKLHDAVDIYVIIISATGPLNIIALETGYSWLLHAYQLACMHVPAI